MGTSTCPREDAFSSFCTVGLPEGSVGLQPTSPCVSTGRGESPVTGTRTPLEFHPPFPRRLHLTWDGRSSTGSNCAEVTVPGLSWAQSRRCWLSTRSRLVGDVSLGRGTLSPRPPTVDPSAIQVRVTAAMQQTPRSWRLEARHHLSPHTWHRAFAPQLRASGLGLR